MKKILIFLLTSLFFLSLSKNGVFAQNVNSNILNQNGVLIPGVNCGMADSGGAEKCCYQKPQGLPKIPFSGILQAAPGIGDAVKEYETKSDLIKNVQIEVNSLNLCTYGNPSVKDPLDPNFPNCRCELSATAIAIPQISEMCSKYFILPSQNNELIQCTNCANGGGMWTGLACVPLSLNNFIMNFLMTLGIGLGGLIALLCIIYSAFMMQTSQGNPEKVKKAQQLLMSCITGLMLIIFSVFILRLVGVNILRIPFS